MSAVAAQYTSDEDINNVLFRMALDQHLQMGQILMKALKLVSDHVLSSSTRSDPIPYHTSILTGQMWVEELLSGHPDCIRNELGVRKHVFQLLLDELNSLGYAGTQHVTLEEQLAIFLYTCVTGLTCRHVGERFQRSNSMISKYFRLMLDAFSSTRIYTKYVQLPRSDQPTPNRILDDPTVYPYFKDAIGAIDGIHIACTPSAAERDATRNQKGFHSQNCLVACNFNLEFMYILSGWEGSVADASVYHDARTTDFTIPDGKYYLADAGYPICPQLLVPYRGTRYHLPEWDQSRMRPANSHEYFNLRHAQLRNVVERTISVLKRRFQILVIPPEYAMGIQAKIPPALCCIHNIIRWHDPDDLSETERQPPATEYPADPADRMATFGTLAEGFITPAERDRMTAMREEIAEQLWEGHIS